MGDILKKVLFYLSWIMLWLACLMTGFAESEQLVFLCCSTLLGSMLLILVYACMDRWQWGTFSLMAMSACVQIPYLMPASPFALYFLGGAAFLDRKSVV